VPIIPSFVERLVFRFNVAPGFMLDYLGAQAFRAGTVAFKLGVFSALSEGPLTVAELARRIGADERGLTLLLDTLQVLGYVRKGASGRYELRPAFAKWLPTFAPDSARFFERVVFDWWGHLDESIRRGGSAMPAMDDEAIRDLQAGMITLARMAGDEIVSRVRVPAGARRLVDLGGGHGLYSVKFLRRHPELSATIVDAANALETTRDVIAQEGMQGRIMTREGNFLTGDIGENYDIALLFNVVHYHLPDRNRELLAAVTRSLNPGGILVVMDQMPGRAFGPTVAALFRLQALHLFNAVSGQTYTAPEVAAWMKAAGLVRTRRLDLRAAMGHGVVVGTKPRA
jgi:SAM-dependent methyltransferase